MELVEELIDKRDRHNAEAEKFKRIRDRLNEQTKEWVGRRDELNAQSRELVDLANDHRVRRNDLNNEVREAKRDRDVWNKNVNELMEMLVRKKKEKAPKKGPSIGQLKKRVRALEFQQMTSVLKQSKEKELIESIAHLQAEIKEREIDIESDEEIKDLTIEGAEAREKAEHYHAKVEGLAESSQKEHDSMMEIYDRSDAIRKEADRAQESFIKCKLQADEAHQKHIELIKQVHDYDKMLSGLRQREFVTTTTEDKRTVKDEAKEIYERFKSGEKLSTEDLMALQKSGYL